MKAFFYSPFPSRYILFFPATFSIFEHIYLAMIKKYTRFVVYVLTILTATLISEWLITLLTGVATGYKYVAIRMAVFVLVYFPLITMFEGYIKKFTQKYAKESKKAAKSSLIGLTIGFSLALFILFALYCMVFDVGNVFVDIKNWFASLF